MSTNSMFGPVSVRVCCLGSHPPYSVAAETLDIKLPHQRHRHINIPLRVPQCNQGQPCSNCARRFPQPVCEYRPRCVRPPFS